MITIHHLNNSRSQRILWLLEELGLDYQIQHYQRDARTMLAPPELMAVHPLGKSPVLSDAENSVAESGAIIEYVLDRYDSEQRLRPAPGSADFLRFRYWLHYAEGSAMPPLLLKLIFDRLPKPPMPFFLRPAAGLIAAGIKAKFVHPQLERHLAFQEQHLTQFPWFAGAEFSAADIQMSFAVEGARSRGVLAGDTHPQLCAFLERIHARPAYQQALQRGGPYELLN